LRQDGIVKDYLSYTGDSTVIGSDTKTRYTKVLRGDMGSDSYRLFVNGENTGKTLELNENGLTENLTKSEVEYYAVSVTVNRNDAPWQGAGVELRADGQLAYSLRYDAGVYKYPYVMKRATDSFGVYVVGSISGADTGKTVNAQNASAQVDYYTASYYDLGNLYLVQTVRVGGQAVEPTAPYHSGKTFIGWRIGPNDTDSLYNFDAVVSGAISLHAGFDAPKIFINGHIKCDENGNINGNGVYYRMANLSIRGYPQTGTPMNSATLFVTNGEVTFADTEGYTVYDNLDDSGNGSVTIVFRNNNQGVSVSSAQQFLRECVIVKVKDSSNQHKMRVSVFGMTN
jgi:hypothetical protein